MQKEIASEFELHSQATLYVPLQSTVWKTVNLLALTHLNS